MQLVTLGNRPEVLAPRAKIFDYLVDGRYIRVSVELVESVKEELDSPSLRMVTLDAQAFEVDANGSNLIAPNGRPSRTESTRHKIVASSLGKTHTLAPGWVDKIGDYTEASFPASVPRIEGRPSGEPDWATNPTGESFDLLTQRAYRWDEGMTAHIVKEKINDMLLIIQNSPILAGIEF